MTTRHRIALTGLAAVAISLAPAFAAGQATAQPVQYKSPEGVEYRSQPETDALIADIRESVDGPIQYSWHTPGERWLRDRLKKRCEA